MLAQTEHSCIFLFGRTGSGKSTIANMFSNNGIADENPRFAVGDGTRGVTIRCDIQECEKYTIIDTIGIGESEVLGRKPHAEAIAEIKDFMREIQNRKIDHICFVMEAGRVDSLDKIYWKCFEGLFGNCRQNMIIIFTKAKKPESWVDDNGKNVINLLNPQFQPDMISVNFYPVSQDEDEERILREKRNFEFTRLESLLINIRERPGYTVVTPRCVMTEEQIFSILKEPLVTAPNQNSNMFIRLWNRFSYSTNNKQDNFIKTLKQYCLNDIETPINPRFILNMMQKAGV